MSVVFDADDHGADALVRHLQLIVETLDVCKQVKGLVVASELDRAGRLDAIEECDSVRSVDFLGDPARVELHEEVVEPAHDPASLVADVDVALREQPQDRGVIRGRDLP